MDNLTEYVCFFLPRPSIILGPFVLHSEVMWLIGFCHLSEVFYK